MGRTSIAARRPDREKIKQAIIDGIPERTIASRFGISKNAVRTMKRTIQDQVALELQKQGARTMDYIQELETLRLVAVKQLKEAQVQDDLPFPMKQTMILNALASAGVFTERLARFTGQSLEKQGGTTNVQINLFEMMPIVRATLTMYPDALAAVERAMRDAMNGNGHHA